MLQTLILVHATVAVLVLFNLSLVRTISVSQAVLVAGQQNYTQMMYCGMVRGVGALKILVVINQDSHGFEKFLKMKHQMILN